MSIDTMPRTGAASTQPVYASFGLGVEEYALDVRHVSEVVNMPPAITPMPLAPAFVSGIFNLRGAVIPVLDARTLLGIEGQPPAEESKIVVMEHAGVRLGLVVDHTGRVLRPRAEEQTLFNYEDNSEFRVVSGVLKIADSLVRVLDLDRLVALENVPHAMTNGASSARAKLQRRRCIRFRVGQAQLAFSISGIDEIVLASGMEPSPVHDHLCEGVLHIRGQVVPVVRFSDVLQTGCHTDAASPEARVIVLALDQARVGLLVDAVESIEAYADDELMHVPVLNQNKASMFIGCLDLGERGHVLLLDNAHVLDHGELSRVTGNYSQLFKARSEATKLNRRAEQRQSFLWFTARDAFGLPMPAVREIIDCSNELIAMPGAPDFVAGMVNLRGKLVTVVDVRAFYRLESVGSADHNDDLRRIIVLDEGDTLLGLLVDSVESIARVDAADRIGVPHLIRNAMPEAQRKDVIEIIQIVEGEKTTHLRVIDPTRIFAAIAMPELEVHA